MRREEMVRMLERHAERLLDLAKSLSDTGRALSIPETQMIRSVLYGTLTEEMAYIRMMFLDGHDISEGDMERITRLFVL